MRGILAILFGVLLSASVSAREILVENKDALSTLRAAPGDKVTMLGYVAAGDGGGQELYYSRTAGGTVDDGFIFDAPGTGSERFIAIDQSTADPVKFGAVAGATSAVTKAAFDAAIATGKPVINRDVTRTFTVNAGIVNSNAVPMEIYGKLISSDNTMPVIQFGTTSAERFVTNRVYRLNVDRPSREEGLEADGVRVINCVDGQWHLSARNCESGIHFRGEGEGLGACSRNQIWVGNINDCMTGIHVQAAGDGGYCNENTFYGGEIDTYSSMSTTGILKGVHLEFNGSTQHYLDGNRFYGQSIELDNVDQDGDPLRYLFYGTFTGGVRAANENIFENFRMENTGGDPITVYRLVGGAGLENNTFRSNFFICGDDVLGGSSPGWRVRMAAWNQFYLRHQDQHYYKLAEIHPRQMVNTASGLSAPPHGTLISAIENFNQIGSSMSVTEKEMTTSTSTRAYVVPIDFRDCIGDETDKTIYVLPNVEADGGQIVCRCYTDPPIIANSTDILGGADDCSIGAYSGSLLLHTLGSNLLEDGQGSGRPYLVPIAFSNAVKFALVGFGQVAGAGNEVHMRSFQIFAKQKSGAKLLRDETTINLMSGNTRYPIFEDQETPRSTEIPTGTIYIHGTLCRNTSEAELGAGVPVFWRFDKADGVWDEVGP